MDRTELAVRLNVLQGQMARELAHPDRVHPAAVAAWARELRAIELALRDMDRPPVTGRVRADLERYPTAHSHGPPPVGTGAPPGGHGPGPGWTCGRRDCRWADAVGGLCPGCGAANGPEPSV
jgi:hypothetical protein